MLDQIAKQKITQASLKHAKPAGAQFAYGTAGFRMLASKLDSVVFAVGLLASLRSKKLAKTIGVMITLSHNPPLDNGVKIVDPMGEMLQQSWEKYATQVANAALGDDLIQVLDEIIELEKIDLSVPLKVVIGRDSRSSGPQLSESTIDGLLSFDTDVKDFGMLTTPQLHYLTRTFNDKSFGEQSEQGYYKKLASSFIEHYKTIESDSSAPLSITVDLANGIGAAKVIELQKYLSDYIEFELVNGEFEEPDLLNVECGADYVKTNQKLPRNVTTPTPNRLYCSFDGDADRIVFYYVDKLLKFHLLDGDKIATMLLLFFSSAVKPLEADLKVGIVQTAYANGSSTNYISDVLQIPVECTPTGVKHLHHKAQQYDIGVYFEANGHGTVLFSDKFIDFVRNHNDKQNPDIVKLRTLVDLINQTVGDAISDLLLVIIICHGLKLTAESWDSLYNDLPNKLAKVIVSDRTAFTTTDAERKLVTPEGLQAEIDSLVTEYKNGRSFVRASGTEDAVRVYAEASTQEACDELSFKVTELVKKYS